MSRLSLLCWSAVCVVHIVTFALLCRSCLLVSWLVTRFCCVFVVTLGLLHCDSVLWLLLLFITNIFYLPALLQLGKLGALQVLAWKHYLALCGECALLKTKSFKYNCAGSEGCEKCKKKKKCVACILCKSVSTALAGKISLLLLKARSMRGLNILVW